MCSVKWASPGRSSGSEKWPACTSSAAAAFSVSGSCTRSTRSPLLARNHRYCFLSLGGDFTSSVCSSTERAAAASRGCTRFAVIIGRRIAAAAASKESDGRRRSRMLVATKPKLMRTEGSSGRKAFLRCQRPCQNSARAITTSRASSRRRHGLSSRDGVPRDNVRAAVAARNGTLGHASGTSVQHGDEPRHRRP